MFCLTESASVTTQEISITGKGKVCGRLQNFIGPLIEIIFADFIGGNILATSFGIRTGEAIHVT